MIKNLRRYENLHIFLWLIKDTCWVLNAKGIGLIIAVPTILVAAHITYLHRKDMVELLHNLAITSWICANITWMIGEFFYDDTTRPYALIFFIAGLLCAGSYYFYYMPFVEMKKRNEENGDSQQKVRSLVGKMLVSRKTGTK
jgi:hypothetical protein